jgi:hypothetical protein
VTKHEEDKLWLAERLALYKYAERTAYDRYLRVGFIAGHEATKNYVERNLHIIMERDFNEPLD